MLDTTSTTEGTLTNNETVHAHVSEPGHPTEPEPTREEIAALAYDLWIERGSPHGSHEEDWHRAEYQLRGRQTMKKTTHE
jgi:hypothetical protein